jgi:transcription elongation GreA/GreB family factor
VRLQIPGVDGREDGVDVLRQTEEAEVVPIAVRVAPVRVAGDHGAQAERVYVRQQLASSGQRLHSIRDRDRHRPPEARHGLRVCGQALAGQRVGDQNFSLDHDLHLG